MPYRYVGQSGPCVECQATFAKTASTKVRCEPCQTNNRLRQQVEKRAVKGAKYNASKALARAKSLGTTTLSTPVSCRRCSAAFIRKSSCGLYCQVCRDAGKWARTTAETRNKVYLVRRAQRKERHKVDAAFALNKRLSAGILHGLGSGKRGCRWETLVGYSLADLMRHLERQFLPGMTWVNRGEWHIDHIVPLSSFKFSSPDDAEFRAAWALTNLRPLWWADNLGKSDKRTFLI